MNKYIYSLLAVLVLTGSVSAGEHKDGHKKDRPAKTAIVKYDFIDINNIFMYLSNNGDMSFNNTTSAAGLEWPKGSGMNAIFEDGIIWGGTVAGTLRVGGSAYRHGLQPGPILPSGDPANPADPKYHIFKVRKVTSETFKNLSTSDQQRLKDDYMNWPVGDNAPLYDNGAPWTNRDGVDGYQPDFDKWLAEQSEADITKRKVDEPFMIGDMVIWYVMNDKDPALTTYLYGSPPIGIELQCMVWGYSSTGPLGNMVFTKYKLKNKGTDDLLNCYLSKWSDPDLGDANDDYVGVDTAMSLGYVYNGYAKDAVYGIPPAAGYDFFQGPIVQSPGDNAIYNFAKKPGYKNLKVSSFTFYINSSGVYKDPTQGDPSGAIEMYNYQQGLLWNGQPFTDPTNGRTTKFPLYGDPITKTGWIDGVPAPPGDRRMMMTAGPFTLKKGDEQEMVVGTLIGRGSDRISSIQVLKYYDKFAQLAFDNNFDLPKAPPDPKVDFALNDRKIIINWGNPKTANASETWNDRGYKFQGYNVYQMPTSSSLLSSAKRLATFDIIDNVATIYDNAIDEKSGALVYIPVQFGTDSDLQRELTVKTDEITGTPLVNNQPYYFAVTAYSYNSTEGIVPAVLESSPTIYTVRPQFPNPGHRNVTRMDSAIVVTRKSGTSSGTPIVQIVDPFKLTGHTYQVNFTGLLQTEVPWDDDGDPTTPPVMVPVNNVGWNLKDLTTGQNLLDTSKWYNGFLNAFDVDGFKIGLTGVPHWIPGKEVLSRAWSGGPSVYDAVSGYNWILGSDFFGSSLAPYDVVKTVEVRFDRTKTSKGYMYLRGGTPNYGYQGYFDSPVSFWDVSDKNNPKQLSYAFVEQNASKYNDKSWGPGEATGDREYIFIMDEPYTDTPVTKYTTMKPNADAGKMPILFAGWFTQNPDYSQAGDSKAYKWKDGDKYTIVANIPYTPVDVFEFTTVAPTYSDVVAKQDVNAVNVFPNPYLGSNAQELNKYQRFVTFNHLPPEATIRVYSLAGTLIKTIQKFDNTQLINWDLRNENGLPVGSGMYIIHVDMPGLGVSKVLKLAVIMEAQFLDRI